MNALRRRIARWLDPEPSDPWIALRPHGAGPFDHSIASQLARIATVLEHMDRDGHQRHRRVIECRHPELHPEVAEALSTTDRSN